MVGKTKTKRNQIRKLLINKIFCVLLIGIITFVFCSCEKSEPIGNFYTLEYAYEQGWVTQEDLMKMAYIHKESNNLFERYDNMLEEFWLIWSKDFISEPKMPETLDVETEQAIKEAHARELCEKPEYSDATKEDVTIYGYCGTYNGYVAVMVMDSFYTYNGEIQLNYHWYESGAKIGSFIYLNALPYDVADIYDLEMNGFDELNAHRLGIYVWKEGETEEYYDLVTAHKQGVFDESEMENIAHYQKENYVRNWRQNFIETEMPEKLDEETEIKVKMTRLGITKIKGNEDEIENKAIGGTYLGIYNGCVVFSSSLVGWHGKKHIVIEDVLFMFSVYGYLDVWKESIK